MPLPLELVHDDRPGRDSHLHWDHAGDPEPFTSAEIVIGAEGASLLEGAYPENHDSMYRAFPQGRPVKHADFEDTHNNSVVSPLYRDCKDVPWDQGATVPDFSFLLTHPTKGKAMFDLGIRKVTLQ